MEHKSSNTTETDALVQRIRDEYAPGALSPAMKAAMREKIDHNMRQRTRRWIGVLIAAPVTAALVASFALMWLAPRPVDNTQNQSTPLNSSVVALPHEEDVSRAIDDIDELSWIWDAPGDDEDFSGEYEVIEELLDT